MKKELLRIDHVTLTRGTEAYLDNISMHIYSGEIIGLLPSSDKGCDQLIELICKNISIDFGYVWYDGKVVNQYPYSDNHENKVYRIESISSLIDGMSIADNIFVMRPGFRKYIIDEQVLTRQAEIFLKEQDIHIDLSKKVTQLSELERCNIEFAKAMMMGAKLIIIDHPASFMSQHELSELQDTLRIIRNHGASIIYIASHHQELFKVADRTLLYSAGSVQKVFEKNEQNNENIVPYIDPFYKMCVESIRTSEDEEEMNLSQDEGVMHLHHVYAGHLKGLDLVLHKGECLTLLDIDNCISEDLHELLTGNMECDRGRVTLSHVNYTRDKALSYLDQGIAIITRDASTDMIFENESYMSNLTFLLDRKIKKSIISPAIYKSIYKEYATIAGAAIDARTMSDQELCDRLSVVYLRMHLYRPKALVCIQPFAIGDMYCRKRVIELLRMILEQGTAVLIVSTNIADTLEVSDRLMVVESGACTSEYSKTEFYLIQR